jgi:hypothetical protein
MCVRGLCPAVHMQDMSVGDAEEQVDPVRPVSVGFAADVRAAADTEVAVVVSGGSWDEWPPLSYAENDHILVWWLPEYDEALRQLVADYQWAWRGAVLPKLESLIPESVLRAWRDSDPQCQEYSWYNVLDVFAAARAKRLGISPRPTLEKMCSCCSRQFLESHLPHRLIARVGVDAIDVCPTCLSQALRAPGSSASEPETVIAVLQALSGALARPLKTPDLGGRLDMRGLSPDARRTVVQALRVKPTAARVRELFGSWEAALARAAAAPPVPLPDYQRPLPSLPADSGFTSSDPARYRTLMGPLPRIALASGHGDEGYYREITSLIGAGYLALAEAALTKLCAQDHEMNFEGLLAQVYGQTARTEEARAAHRTAYRSPGAGGEEVDLGPFATPRDVRTITAGPAFYSPLPSPPRGNVCFVLVGGPMEYVDRRGEHNCVTGEPPQGGTLAGLAESVARMSAMVDGEPWMQAAAETGQAIIASLVRAGAEPSRPYAHMIAYVTSRFRGVVKGLTGSLPKKVAPDAWGIAPVGKSRWSYQRDAGHYFYNASAGFGLMAVETAPAVCIWAWPDRSDGCLQAFLDTVAGGAAHPVFVILPDVPAYRDFARRYVRAEQMARTERTLIEDHLYRSPPEMVNKRGYVLAAEFAPRLVIRPDGTEHAGTLLAGAIAYLDAHHTLRLSVRDILSDGLLQAAALAACPVPRSFAVTAEDRADMVLWYSQLPEFEEPGVLLRPFRPSLLDAVLPA